MDLALNTKYKMLIESNQWNLPAVRVPKIDAQIIALTAKLEYFKKTNNDAAAEKKEKLVRPRWQRNCHMERVDSTC